MLEYNASVKLLRIAASTKSGRTSLVEDTLIVLRCICIHRFSPNNFVYLAATVANPGCQFRTFSIDYFSHFTLHLIDCLQRRFTVSGVQSTGCITRPLISRTACFGCNGTCQTNRASDGQRRNPCQRAVSGRLVQAPDPRFWLKRVLPSA